MQLYGEHCLNEADTVIRDSDHDQVVQCCLNIQTSNQHWARILLYWLALLPSEFVPILFSGKHNYVSSPPNRRCSILRRICRVGLCPENSDGLIFCR